VRRLHRHAGKAEQAKHRTHDCSNNGDQQSKDDHGRDRGDGPLHQDQDDPPEWNVDVPDGHEIGTVRHGIVLLRV